MKRILITGAAGSIGSALTYDLLQNKNGGIVCALDSSEDGLFRLRQNARSLGIDENLRDFLGDIRDLERIKFAMDSCTEVYHCAALKHVHLSEYNPFEAIRTNIDGTNNIVQAALEGSVEKAIITSSDKAVNPTSMMGSTKLVAEKLFIAANKYSVSKNKRFGVVRFGNVWNSNGSVGRIFLEQLKNGKDLTITDVNMTRFFITMDNAIQLCKYSISHMIGGEIFTRSMGSASIKDIANEFIKSNKDLKCKIIGPKVGEKLYEELFTELESLRTIYKDETYITIPEKYDFPSDIDNDLEFAYKEFQRCKVPLRSDSKSAISVDIANLVSRIIQ